MTLKVEWISGGLLCKKSDLEQNVLVFYWTSGIEGIPSQARNDNSNQPVHDVVSTVILLT